MKKQDGDPVVSDHNTTKGVELLLGNPKKAIIRLSIPMIIAMSVQTVYNLVDAIWVAGLGADELSAVGFFFPFFFLIMALASGLGIGGGAAISRRIGAKDKDGADNAADHIIIMMVIIALIFTIPTFILLPSIFEWMKAGDVAGMAAGYGRIIVGGTLIIFFANNANAILRAEGDTKRAMYAMVLGSILNIFLDPIFIYVFGLGVQGAAWATMLSFSITAILLFYWLFLGKDTYITFRLSSFKFNWDIIKDIWKVGLPASLQQMSMSIQMIILNLIVVTVGGTDGIAIFSTGWRVTSIAILPLMGIAAALISVAGAAYGARDYRKLRAGYIYAIKFGLIMEMIISVIIFVFAEPITLAFTWSEGSAHLSGDLIIFLRIMILMNFSAGFGMLSGAVFQAIGKGFYSLLVTLFRTIIFAVSFSYLLGIMMDQGLPGIWFGIIIGGFLGAGISFFWMSMHVRGLIGSSSASGV
ncbi:MAG: MATE family efflux transporter [Thermoplasmatota archaeon]